MFFPWIEDSKLDLQSSSQEGTKLFYLFLSLPEVEGPMREAEELLVEVRDAGIGGWLLCRLLVGVGVALPKCGRNEDAVAVLTDAVHIARAK